MIQPNKILKTFTKTIDQLEQLSTKCLILAGTPLPFTCRAARSRSDRLQHSAPRQGHRPSP